MASVDISSYTLRECRNGRLAIPSGFPRRRRPIIFTVEVASFRVAVMRPLPGSGRVTSRNQAAG